MSRTNNTGLNPRKIETIDFGRPSLHSTPPGDGGSTSGPPVSSNNHSDNNIHQQQQQTTLTSKENVTDFCKSQAALNRAYKQRREKYNQTPIAARMVTGKNLKNLQPLSIRNAEFCWASMALAKNEFFRHKTFILRKKATFRSVQRLPKQQTIESPQKLKIWMSNKTGTYW